MKTLVAILIAMTVFVCDSFSQELNVGDKAPVFKTQSDDGSVWDLNDYLGNKFIVV